VVKIAPAWTDGFNAVELTHGVTVIGAQMPAEAGARTAFKAQVAMRVSGAIEGAWMAVIKGIKRGGKGEFVWEHPISDGAWITNLWQKDQIVVDRTWSGCRYCERGFMICIGQLLTWRMTLAWSRLGQVRGAMSK